MTARTKTAVFLIVIAGLAGMAATLMMWLTPAYAEQATVAPPVDSGVLQWGFVAAALAAGLSSLGAGYAVAVVGSAAIGALAEKPELLGRVLVMVGLAEGIAIYGLIVSILILNRLI